MVARGRRLEPDPGEKGGAETGPSPVDRGRAGSKHHLLTDAHGTPLAWALTGSNRNDITQLLPLLDRVPPVAGLPGRPRRDPRRCSVTAATAPTHTAQALRQRGITPLLANRYQDNGSGLGRYRWVVERTFSWLHQMKRLLVRYERRADIHEAFLALGCCLICFRRLNHSF